MISEPEDVVLQQSLQITLLGEPGGRPGDLLTGGGSELASLSFAADLFGLMLLLSLWLLLLVLLLLCLPGLPPAR